MKKMLFVIQSLNAGGAEKSLVNLLNMIDYSKYKVDLLVFAENGIFFKQVPNDVKIINGGTALRLLYNTKVNEKISKKLFYMSIRFASNILLRVIYRGDRYIVNQKRWEKVYSKLISNLSQDYDIAVAYMHGEAAYYVAEKVNAKRKIVWIHHDYSAMGYDHDFDRKRFSKYNVVVSISDKCVEVFKEIFPELSKKTICLPNLTSKDFTIKLARSEYPKEYKNKNNKIIIVSIGRLHEQKGFDLSIDAAKRLKDKGYSFNWFIIGTGTLKRNLEKLIINYGVQDCFKLLGLRENPYPYIYHADIFVQSSRYEGKSVVVDEAKILEKPIVCTNYLTVADQIINGDEGIIVDMNADSIANGIEKIINNEELKKHLEFYLSTHKYDNADEIAKYYEIF